MAVGHCGSLGRLEALRRVQRHVKKLKETRSFIKEAIREHDITAVPYPVVETNLPSVSKVVLGAPAANQHKRPKNERHSIPPD